MPTINVYPSTGQIEVFSQEGPPGPPGPSAVSTDAGNAARLGSDALIFVPPGGVPGAHQQTHHTGGGDQIPVATTASTGLLPILPNVATQYLNGTGVWSTPAGGGSGDMLKSVYDTTNDGVVDNSQALLGHVTPASGNATAAQVVLGNDTRLSDARTPTAHGATHLDNGTDVIPVVTTTRTGLTPKLSGTVTTFLNGTGSFSTPAGGGGGDMTKAVYDINNDGIVDQAAAVPWTGVSGKPATFAPSAHAPSHESGGADAIPLDALGAPTDVTTLNASLTAHGLLPKLGGGTGNFLRADGTWASPPAGGGGGDMLKSVYDVNNDSIVDHAALADTAPWTGITGKPATFSPSAHGSTHAGGGSDPVPIATTTVAGLVPAKPNAGVNATSTQVVMGDDTRLTNSRVPTAHASTHESGGSDSIPLDTLGIPTDITTLNASTTAHGLLPKLGGGTANFLRADGTWAAPAGGGDMLKSVYDTNNDSIVDHAALADTAPWTGISGKPATFPPSTVALTTCVTFTIPAAGSTISVSLGSGTDIVLGGYYFLTDGTKFMNAQVTASPGTLPTLLNLGAGGATSGTMAAGRVYPGNVPANVSTTAAGLVPIAPNDATKVLRGDGAFGTLAYSSLGSIPATFNPSAHAPSHEAGGSDTIPLDTLAAPTDITTLNASTTAHGLMPKANGSANSFYGSDATQKQVTYAMLGGSQPGPVAHAASHVTVGQDQIALPTTTLRGLAPPIPATNAGTQFHRGDNVFAPANYPDLTNIPATFAPSGHASTHLSAGSDPIALATTAVAGLCPPPDGTTIQITGGKLVGFAWAPKTQTIPNGSGTITIDCAGATSISILANWTSAGGTLVIALQHVGPGVPITLAFTNNFSSAVTYAITATDPSNTAFTAVTAAFCTTTAGAVPVSLATAQSLTAGNGISYTAVTNAGSLRF